MKIRGSRLLLDFIYQKIMVLNLLTRSLIQSAGRGLNGGAPMALAATASNKILDNVCRIDSAEQWPLINYIQNRGAARKGKRIQRARENRQRAAKRREAGDDKDKKKHQRSQVKLDKSQFRFLDAKRSDQLLPDSPSDNVYFMDKFKPRKFSFTEAINFHKQVVHPDVLNVPDSFATAIIELNLKMKIKKRKYIEKIESTVCFPHVFKYQVRPRKIIALCKNPDDQEKAREAGATIAGSNDIADQLKKNQLTERDFDHLVCHMDYLTEFAALKGMKGQSYFPNKSRGNFGEDIVELVRYFKDGIDYKLIKSEGEPETGIIECHFGKLDMDHKQLQDNLVALFESVTRFKPLNLADDKQFFERVAITTPATDEMFFIKFWDIYDEYDDPVELARDAKADAVNA